MWHTILFYVFIFIFNSLHVSSTSCSSSGETNCVNTTSGSCHCVSVAMSSAGLKWTSDLQTTRPPTATRGCIDTISLSWWWARCAWNMYRVTNRNKYIEKNLCITLVIYQDSVIKFCAVNFSAVRTYTYNILSSAAHSVYLLSTHTFHKSLLSSLWVTFFTEHDVLRALILWLLHYHYCRMNIAETHPLCTTCSCTLMHFTCIC